MSIHSSGHSDPARPISRLGESLVQTAESQRVLVQELTSFAKDEGLRFANLRMERNGAALDRLQDCQGILGLLGVQQEWLRDFVQDYADQNTRLIEAWRGLTRNMMATAAETASDTVDRMQDDVRAHQADDVVNHAEDMGHQVVQHVGEQLTDIGQDANTYIQH